MVDYYETNVTLQRTFEYTEGDLIAQWSEGFRDHMFVLWVALFIYTFINRYKYYLQEKGVISLNFVKQWEHRSHDIALLICLYYPLIYIIYPR